jgi:hypothetical protein
MRSERPEFQLSASLFWRRKPPQCEASPFSLCQYASAFPFICAMRSERSEFQLSASPFLAAQAAAMRSEHFNFSF